MEFHPRREMSFRVSNTIDYFAHLGYNAADDNTDSHSAGLDRIERMKGCERNA